MLGLDAKETLAAASYKFNGEVDVAGLVLTEEHADGSVARIVSSGIFHSTAAAEEDASLTKEDRNWLDLGEDTEEDIQSAFRSMLDEAAQNRLPTSGNTKLCVMLQDYPDLFRLKIGNDPPGRSRTHGGCFESRCSTCNC